MVPTARRRPAQDDEPTLADVLRELREFQRLMLARFDAISSKGLCTDLFAAAHGTMLHALADSMDGFDLPFSVSEVLHHSTMHHELDAALTACGKRTPAAVGALFRSLRGRDVGGLMLVRDGRLWRLVRTCRT